MKCIVCSADLIWQADHDIEEENEDFAILSHYDCPNCKAFIEVYQRKKEKNDG